MRYILICQDKPDSEALRKQVRSDHLAYLQGFEVHVAGPMLAEDEATMIGSVIVIEAADKAAAEAFAASDPYALAGLFEQVTIRPFKQVIPG